MASRNTYKRSFAYEPPYPAPPPDRSTAPSPFRIDEGFSEETRSQAASDTAFDPEPIPIDGNEDEITHDDSVRQWLLSQPLALRAGLTRELMSSLPNSILSQLVSEANERLHFDPLRCLPHEIVSNIFEFLDASTLAQASLVSRLWRDHTFEPRLWRRLFGQEGWTHDQQKLRSFEDKSRTQIQDLWTSRKVRARHENSTIRGSRSRRLLHDPSPHEKDRTSRRSSRLWVENGSIGMPPAWTGHGTADSSGNVIGQDVEVSDTHSEVDEEMNDAADDFEAEARDMESGTSNSLLPPESPVCPLLTPSHLLDTATESPQPNWHHIYKQRRRLEQNWSAGRFTAFRLPHLDFKEEAHRQCVYSLQFTAKHLVSGSRDKTIRVWDLSKQRLKLPPLQGHQGSVLCLQFDERLEQDVIISGGSDSDVIVWRFSTGEIVTRLNNAHSESVLNLRFDERYLVTCSKDKTIKLWNRKLLSPTDPEYPQANRSPNAHYPDYIINVNSLTTAPSVEPLQPYTLLMTFNQHNAAVNAIQIFGNEIVSASGDRTIMLWDIRTGTLIREFKGHSKGIACVQYDGRRIISGSSDNSVRIFDSSTAAEVAVLDGHENLVRTVQGDFGDLAEDPSELEAEARRNDEAVIEEKRQRLHNGQSATLDEPFVFGAKLPPGGGGNRWSKIVSGSYDETVIIWRKSEGGKWFPAKQLRQEDAMRATAPPGEVHQSIPVETFETTTRSGFVRVSSGQPFPLTSTALHIFEQAKALGMPSNFSTREGIQWIQRNLLICRTAWGYLQFYRLRFWHFAGNNDQATTASSSNENTAGSSQAATHASDANLSSAQQQQPQQEPMPQTSNVQPAHLHPTHPHYQYHLAPHMISADAQRQMPSLPRVNAQLRQPQLQHQLHHRLTLHIIQNSHDLNMIPGPNNVPTEPFQLGQAHAMVAGSQNQGLIPNANFSSQIPPPLRNMQFPPDDQPGPATQTASGQMQTSPSNFPQTLAQIQAQSQNQPQSQHQHFVNPQLQGLPPHIQQPIHLQRQLQQQAQQNAYHPQDAVRQHVQPQHQHANQHTPPFHHHHHHHHPMQQPPQLPIPQHQQTNAGGGGGGPAGTATAPPAANPQQQAHHPAHRAPHANQEGGLSRVFKLQFDSRRIICCSQQPVIVGWDFANGDADIEEASQFFDGGSAM